MGKNGFWSKCMKIILCLAAAGLLLLAAANAVVILSVRRYIISPAEAAEKNADCALVLGANVWSQGLSPMLEDRVLTGIRLYEDGATDRLLMSGDHGRKDYDEVNVMRKYAMERGVPSEDIFLDHAGFSTYETMVRAKDVFGVRKVLVVTQKYHLYRALYDAAASGMEASGVAAVGHSFGLQLMWNIRESAARVKDFVWCLFKPEPTYRGERIDITGNGEVTLG